MTPEADVIWSGKPWVGPSVALRSVVAVAVGIVAFAVLSSLGMLSSPILTVPVYVWALGILAFAWLASLARLLVLRASLNYVLRRSSVEVYRGIARKRTLIVSPSGFSELELDQGILGRVLDYGSIEVRSQGGQQLNLRLIRDPKGVAGRIRDVMTVPTVRIAKDDASQVASGDQKA
jgi:uncharacterized membrane protein YdbT with pleckstrin-like domain